MSLLRPLISTLISLISIPYLPAQPVDTPTTAPLNPARIAQIATWLPTIPLTLGPPITDRLSWSKLGAHPAYQTRVKAAVSLAGRPIPLQPDDLYLEFSRNGNRVNFEKVAFDRRRRLSPLVIGECVENQGRFLPAIEDLITTLCAEKAWVLPAHDRKLNNYNDTQITIDLFSSHVGWELATARHLLGPKLRPQTIDLINDNLNRRILTPFFDMIRGKRKLEHWFTITNNWNSVLLAGILGTGLMQVQSPQERAELIAAAEQYSNYFLSGFTPDGYCSEGLGYWNYGFLNYVMLSETIRTATNGKLHLLARPGARLPAQFGSRIQIQNGVSPAFADCAINASPTQPLMWFINRRFGLAMPQYQNLDWPQTQGSLQLAMLYAYPAQDQAVIPAPSSTTPQFDDAHRSWFENAGVLVARGGSKLGVALKGGHNAEHHNHNDLGSYVAVVGNKPLFLDPGAETYTARTFSGKRYDSKLLNSYGHPVPVIAGKLQEKGKSAQAKVLESTFTSETDTLRLDLTSAYSVPELQKLERTFIYDRRDAGSLTIQDIVQFTTPQTYENALITATSHTLLSKNQIQVSDGSEQLTVSIDSGSLPLKISEETIQENAPVRPTRLGIRIQEPILSATVTLRIHPGKP